MSENVSEGTKNVNYTSRADNSNSYTRLPICRTLSNVNSKEGVKIILKDILYKNSQMVAILFRSNALNDTLGVGLPILNSGNYYSSSKQSSGNTDAAYILNNTPINPANTTIQSDSDKIR